MSLKANVRDKQIPASFEKACNIFHLEQVIERNYNILISWETRNYVKQEHVMKWLQFI